MATTVQKAFASGFSKHKEYRHAIREVSSSIQKGLAGKSCDLALFFVSETYAGLDPEVLIGEFRDTLSCRHLLGCNSAGVIGTEREIEMEPAIAAIGMHLPGVRLQPFTFTGDQVRDFRTGLQLIKSFDLYPTEKPHFICLADPHSCDVVHLLEEFNEAYKGLPVVGGLSSSGAVNVPTWLCLDDTVHDNGAVGYALTGDIEFDVVVSQGCRPIGKPYVVTKAEDNILYELAGRPALVVIRELLEGLNEKERRLAEQSLHVGLAMDEHRDVFRRGDFLIRNLMGFDPDEDSLVVGATLKVGQTLQFQVRDAETSEEDLRHCLKGLGAPDPKTPRGAVLFSCVGRGKYLYGKPDHDARMIQQAIGPLPMAGFFANGEMGPVGIKNFVHGYTSSLLVIR